MAIPADRNVVQKEAEKKLQYKSLCIEIQRMWNLKCTIIPVIIRAIGIVKRSLRKNLEAVPGKRSIDLLQKTAILGTSHIIRKVMQCEPERWGSPLVQEKYREEKTYDKRYPYHIIIIIIIIIINNLEYTWATYQETMTLTNYRKQPYWALHTYFGKC